MVYTAGLPGRRMRARIGSRLASALDASGCDDEDRALLGEIMADLDSGSCNLDQAMQRVNEHLAWRVNLLGLAAGAGISAGGAGLFGDLLAIGSEAATPTMAHPAVTALMDGSAGIGSFAIFTGGLISAWRLARVARRRSVLRQSARRLAARTSP